MIALLNYSTLRGARFVPLGAVQLKHLSDEEVIATEHIELVAVTDGSGVRWVKGPEAGATISMAGLIERLKGGA